MNHITTHPEDSQQKTTFSGFEEPTENWSKLPHSFIQILPTIETIAEMKVVLYILRHTWGYMEFDKPKPITTDEFMNGRKDKHGNRLDNGTGLSEPSIRAGLVKAIEHGLIVAYMDDSDAARIVKAYMLNMNEAGVKVLPSENASGGKSFSTGAKKINPRSEKDTKERNSRERTAKSPTGKKSYPVKIKDWTWKYIEQYATENPQIDTLAGVYAELCPALRTLPTRQVAQDAIEVFQELERLKVSADRYTSLRDFALARKFNRDYTIFKRMLWSIPDWIKRNPPANKKTTLDSMALNAAVFHEGGE